MDLEQMINYVTPGYATGRVRFGLAASSACGPRPKAIGGSRSSK